MRSINTYPIFKDEWICYNSKICNVACSLGYINQFSDLDNRIHELVQSFFNQWQFVIVTYDKLCKLLNTLNECSDKHDSVANFSEYDIKSADSEVDFKNHTYLLIVSIKTYLDLFACLVDIIQVQEIKEEWKLPDFYNIGNNKKENIDSEIILEFNKLRDQNIYPWIALVKSIRDKIIHRGYQLKPNFGLRKSEELTIRAYKGTDFYVSAINIEIGKLFHEFMSDMPEIEERISNILIRKVDTLNSKLSLTVSFRSDGWINEYKYEEIEPQG